MVAVCLGSAAAARAAAGTHAFRPEGRRTTSYSPIFHLESVPPGEQTGRASDHPGASHRRPLMNRARSFLYVCLGVLALAVAVQLGARSAQSQGGAFVLGGVNGAYQCAVDAGGAFWFLAEEAPGGRVTTFGPLAPPRTGTPMEVDPSLNDSSPSLANTSLRVLYSDGDAWHYYYGTWYHLGNLGTGGPVPTALKTWGRIKAERR